jgi:hypothetical protein
MSNSSRRNFLKKSIGSAAALSGPVIIAPAEAGQNADGEKRTVRLRFAVASDGHFGQPKTEYLSFHQNIVNWLNRENELRGLDFCVFNGDMIHDDPKFLPQAKEVLSGLKVPMWVTKGNHDMVTSEVWQATWGYPPDHSFTKGDYVFVLGNTSNEKGEYLCADVTWLKNTLNKYRKKKAVFVFLHITQRKWTGAGIECPEVMQTLASHPNIAAIFHGHDHDEHDIKTADGKPYLFDGHFGGNWGLPYKGYRIVEMLDNGKVRTYQYNPELNPVMNHQLL